MTPLPFSLIVITDWGLGREVLLRRLEAALAAGPGIAVQHRHPGVSDRLFFDEAVELAAVCGKANAPLFINSRLDVALALGAHLHCTSTSLTPREGRRLLPGRWISCAVHSADEDVDGADLALVSPVFQPGSKPTDSRPLLGVDGYARLTSALPCPAFALGGIEPGNVADVRAPGVAVISAVLRATAPAAAAKALLAGTQGPPQDDVRARCPTRGALLRPPE
ncbi:MAG: thiamine phosphate synthase [Myxococcaceae bacterium]|nr:thiamine phosphate synthase [Myxococcaceae bacterium]